MRTGGELTFIVDDADAVDADQKGLHSCGVGRYTRVAEPASADVLALERAKLNLVGSANRRSTSMAGRSGRPIASRVASGRTSRRALPTSRAASWCVHHPDRLVAIPASAGHASP